MGCGGAASIETSGWPTGGATPIAFRSPPARHSIPRESEQEARVEPREVVCVHVARGNEAAAVSERV